jgi:citrate lyase subunit beta/citryl-CoA lyase
MSQGLLRSKLFVPGTRTELFPKALASGADAISFDLEDAVPDSRKDEARAAVASFLQSLAARDVGQQLIVRTNAPGTAAFETDVLAVARRGVALLNLPKPESAADILAAVAMIEAAESANAVTEPIGLLVNIETPAALRRAAEIAAAHPRVVGLQLGLGDLFEPLGIDRQDVASVHAVMLAVRMAAGEAGVVAIDGAFADVEDARGFRAEAEMARRLGFVGKSCIHPRQVALANEVFSPNANEVAAARRVVEAYGDAAARGHGAYLIDGRMIDAPFLRRAEAIIAAANRAAGDAT